MQAKADSKVAPTRNYQDYAPATEIVKEEDCDTLLIYLPGFKKDQLRVQLTPTPSLKISGERHLGDNKWSRFQKEFPISTNCETNKITAKFDVGTLYIRQPKLVTPMDKKNEEKSVNEAQTTEMKNVYNKRDETKSGDKKQDENKAASKSEETDASGVAQKLKEEVKEKVRDGTGNDEKGKRKKVDELETENFMAGRIMMAKKAGRTMSGVVVILTAIVVGIYVKNLIMPATNYDN